MASQPLGWEIARLYLGRDAERVEVFMHLASRSAICGLADFAQSQRTPLMTRLCG
jgi:hypothetical protein